MACHPFKVGEMSGIICTGRTKSKPCHYCPKRSICLCDHPVIRKGKRGTCDTPMCIDCRQAIEASVDLCRAHHNLWRNNGCKFKLGDVEVLS